MLLWSLAGLDDVRNHPREKACARTSGGLSDAEWSDAGIDIVGYQDICPGR